MKMVVLWVAMAVCAACGDGGSESADPSCSDGVANGDETDVDCGGACGPCADGQACAVADDCTSADCDGGTCQATPGCDDGVRGGDETDVDCGGGCEPCADGQLCGEAADCSSGTCDATCQAATCDDGIANGDETGIDCDGACAACLTVIDDFEGSTSAWTVVNATFEVDPDTSSTALRVRNLDDVEGCHSGTASRAIELPDAPRAFRYTVSGDVTGGIDPLGQAWFTIGGRLGLPALPIGESRVDTFCVPTELQGTTATLQFVVRSQGTCTVGTQYEAWYDDLELTADVGGCVPFEPND